MIDRASMITAGPMEDYAIEVFNDLDLGMIAQKVFTPYFHKRANYKQWQGNKNHLRLQDFTKSSKAAAKKIDWGGFYTEGVALLHANSSDIDPKDERDLDKPLNELRMRAAKRCMQGLALEMEYAAVSKIVDTALYPSDLKATLAADATWIVPGGDPKANVDAAKAAVRLRTGREANAMVLSYEGMQGLRRSPAIAEYHKFVAGVRQATDEEIKQFFGVEYIDVSMAIYNNAIEGAADSLASVFNDTCLVYLRDESVDQETVRYGTMHMVGQMYTEENIDVNRGSGAGRVKVLEMGWEWKPSPAYVISSSDADFGAGFLISNII